MATASLTPARPPMAARLQRLVPRFMRVHEGELDKTRLDRTRKDWFVDITAFVCALGFGALLHVDALNKEPGGPSEFFLILDVILLPIGSAMLFWRRRWPFWVAVATGVMSIFASSLGIACLIATYALAAYARQGRAYVGLALLFLTVPLTTVFWSIDREFWTNFTFGLIATAAAFAWGSFAGARRQLLLSLEDRAARAESEQQLRVDQARLQERTRIAREMHDVLAHRMSLLSVHAGALEFRPDAPPEDVARAAGVIRATAHEALEELRTVIGVMRVADTTTATAGDAPADAAAAGVPDAPQPTLADVPHLVDEWRQAGAKIDLAITPAALDQLPATVSRTAYRVVQESLTNVGKHAPRSKVTVGVGGEPGQTLTISVVNAITVGTPVDGAAIPGTGLGLVGLRERTELVGGVFAAGVDPDLRRFVVEARLPWSAA